MPSNGGTNISNNKGDVFGVDISGNNNVIVKNMLVLDNGHLEDIGLDLLSPNHFEVYNNTAQNFESWIKNGYAFSLESIYDNKEYRRKDLILELKRELEEKKYLLLLGQAGTSKTTLIMELMCDYFHRGFKIFYNLGNDQLTDENTIMQILNDMVLAKNKILLVVDNAHNPKVSLIFKIIKNLQYVNEAVKNNIYFLLAARQPDFQWSLEKNLYLDSNLVLTVEELFDDSHRYIVPYFNLEEIKGFIMQYHDYLPQSKRNKPLDQITREIFEDTDGYPIMVRFSVLNEGLLPHVIQMYLDYIVNNGTPDIKRLKVVILNSLFDISNVSLKDGLLGEFSLLETACSIEDTIIKKSKNIWKTIHPLWDLELFKYIFSLNYSLYYIKKSFKEIVIDIVKNKKISSIDKLSVLNTTYCVFVNQNVAGIDTIESIIDIQNIENEFDSTSKVSLYANIVGLAYSNAGKDKEAIDFFDRALKINPSYADAHLNKGLSLYKLFEFEKSLVEYSEALKENPTYVQALIAMSLSLIMLNKKDEAKQLIDKIIMMGPQNKLALFIKQNLEK